VRFFNSWDEMRVGDSIEFRRTFTGGDVSNFTGITGDFNKFHIDDISARKCGFDRRIVPGLLTGAMLTHAGGTLLPEPYLASEMSFRFLAPVYIGETITAVVEVVEKNGRKLKLEMVCNNEKGEQVLTASVFGIIAPCR
jgi:3-hydroxybutyryl-CoA dehydratase